MWARDARWQSSVKLAFAATLARAWRTDQGQVRPLVLGYHRVVDDFAATAGTDMPAMLTSASTFAQHLDWLADRFRFVSLDEIGERADCRTPFTEPVVAITIDDSYRDVYDHAYPALVRRRVPATLFVVTDLIGRTAWHTHDHLYRLFVRAFATWRQPGCELPRLLGRARIPPLRVRLERRAVRSPFGAVTTLLANLSRDELGRVTAALEDAVDVERRPPPETLTWSMLAEMQRGGMTVGSHTKTHVALPCEDRAIVEDELAGSKELLEHTLGTPVRHFAYPGGQFTRPVVEAVRAAGYRYAYTACRHEDSAHPVLTQRRLLLSERSAVDRAGRFAACVFRCLVFDRWPPARRCERSHA